MAKLAVAEARLGVEQAKAQPDENTINRLELAVAKAERAVAKAEIEKAKADGVDENSDHFKALVKYHAGLVDGAFLFSLRQFVFLTSVFPLTAAFPTAAGGEGTDAGMGKGQFLLDLIVMHCFVDTVCLWMDRMIICQARMMSLCDILVLVLDSLLRGRE